MWSNKVNYNYCCDNAGYEDNNDYVDIKQSKFGCGIKHVINDDDYYFLIDTIFQLSQLIPDDHSQAKLCRKMFKDKIQEWGMKNKPLPRKLDLITLDYNLNNDVTKVDQLYQGLVDKKIEELQLDFQLSLKSMGEDKIEILREEYEYKINILEKENDFLKEKNQEYLMEIKKIQE